MMGTQAMRSGLSPGRALHHAGLTLNRYLQEHADAAQKTAGQRPEEQLLEKVSRAKAPEVYHTAFERWRNLQSARGAQLFFGELVAPLAVGLGNESPLEIGLTLHHTYGMPLVPGSALKGLCRRAACRFWNVETSRDLLEEEASSFRALFGDTESASYIVFWDAWYDPGSVGGSPFKRDVVTVHHPHYYGGKDVWPTDFDDPTPVPFLVVRPGTRFLFAVDAPDDRWGLFVQRLLRWALERLGIGAKTNAGYGYFRFDPSAVDPPAGTGVPAVERKHWVDARVLFRANTGEIHAVSGQQRAVARAADRDKVLEGLSPEQRRRLLEKGEPRRLDRAVVEVEPLGNGWRLVRVIQAEP